MLKKAIPALLSHNRPMHGSHLCFRDRCQQGCWHRAYRGEADQGKVPVALFPAERARHGRRAPVLQAEHDCVAPQVFTACLGNKGAIQASRAQPIPNASLSWRVSAFPAGTCGTPMPSLAFLARSTKSVVFALLHFSNTCRVRKICGAAVYRRIRGRQIKIGRDQG